MIGIDTFSWNKILLLYHSEWKDIIDELIDKTEIFVTGAGKIEFEYRFPDDLNLLNRIIIYPVLNTDVFKKYSKIYRFFRHSSAGGKDKCFRHNIPARRLHIFR